MTFGKVAAVVAAVGALAMLATLLALGVALGWIVELTNAAGEPEPADLRVELPWLTMLTIGVVVGAILAARRPRHPIPWLLVGLGLGFIAFPTTVAVVAYATLDQVPTWVPYVAWVGNWVWVVGSASGIYLLLLFPDGSPLSPRWQLVVRIGYVYVGLLAVLVAVWPVLEAAPRLANPFGVEALRGADAALMAAVIGIPLLMLLAAISLVLRFVRSAGVERAQMKWMAFAGAGLGLVILAGLVADSLMPRWVQALPTGLLVLAIVVAVTRYRLYEIDRIISRTVTYASVSLILIGVYAAGVLGVGTLLQNSGGRGGDIVIAASTLAAAALFQPLRRRVQTLVDRRFNRSRYDAIRTVEDFAQRLRDEVDVKILAGEVRSVAQRTLQPGRASLWFPERPVEGASPTVVARSCRIS